MPPVSDGEQLGELGIVRVEVDDDRVEVGAGEAAGHREGDRRRAGVALRPHHGDDERPVVGRVRLRSGADATDHLLEGRRQLVERRGPRPGEATGVDELAGHRLVEHRLGLVAVEDLGREAGGEDGADEAEGEAADETGQHVEPRRRGDRLGRHHRVLDDRARDPARSAALRG